MKYIEPGLEFKKKSRSNGRSKMPVWHTHMRETFKINAWNQIRGRWENCRVIANNCFGQMNRDEGSYLLQEYLHVRECRKKHGVLTRKHKPQTN